jgi:hypothetical protein
LRIECKAPALNAEEEDSVGSNGRSGEHQRPSIKELAKHAAAFLYS